MNSAGKYRMWACQICRLAVYSVNTCDIIFSLNYKYLYMICHFIFVAAVPQEEMGNCNVGPLTELCYLRYTKLAIKNSHFDHYFTESILLVLLQILYPTDTQIQKQI